MADAERHASESTSIQPSSDRTQAEAARSETIARIAAFSDGVIAIIVTIMVLELKTPVIDGHVQGNFDFSYLSQMGPKFLAYLISFIFIVSAWVSHVSIMRGLTKSSASLLWLNAVYLFFMSLIPWATATAGEHPLLPQAVAVWGLILTLVMFWGGVPMTHHINTLSHRVPAWARRRNIFFTMLIGASVPFAFLSVYFAWFVIMLSMPVYGLPNKLQKRMFSFKDDPVEEKNLH